MLPVRVNPGRLEYFADAFMQAGLYIFIETVPVSLYQGSLDPPATLIVTGIEIAGKHDTGTVPGPRVRLMSGFFV